MLTLLLAREFGRPQKLRGERRRVAVDALERTVVNTLLLSATVELEGVAGALAELYDRWVAAGADDAALMWLGGLLSELGFWSGALAGAVNPDLADIIADLA